MQRRIDPSRPGFLEAKATRKPIRKNKKQKAQRVARRMRRLNDKS